MIGSPRASENFLRGIQPIPERASQDHQCSNNRGTDGSDGLNTGI